MDTLDGKMEAGLRGSSIKRRSKVVEHTSGSMVLCMRVNGSKGKCTVTAALNSSMVESTRGPLKTIRSTVMVSSLGAMEEAIWVNGTLESSMVSGCLLKQMDVAKKVNGRMALELPGSRNDYCFINTIFTYTLPKYFL